MNQGANRIQGIEKEMGIEARLQAPELRPLVPEGDECFLRRLDGGKVLKHPDGPLWNSIAVARCHPPHRHQQARGGRARFQPSLPMFRDRVGIASGAARQQGKRWQRRETPDAFLHPAAVLVKGVRVQASPGVPLPHFDPGGLHCQSVAADLALVSRGSDGKQIGGRADDQIIDPEFKQGPPAASPAERTGSHAG